MDRIWQWAWDRHGARYSWTVYAIMSVVTVPLYLVPALVVVAYEESSHYVEAVAFTVVAVLVWVYLLVLPGLGWSRFVEWWAAGQLVDRAKALEGTYNYARRAVCCW